MSTALNIEDAGPLMLPLADIEIDPELQARASGINNATVREYREAMRPNGDDDPKDRKPADFPAVVVFRDKQGKHWLADGFHRCAAAVLLPERDDGSPRMIKVEIREGSRRDAQLHAIGANFSHGLKRSNADRRKAALMLLTDATWGKRSDTWIAKQANVSQPFVSKLRSTHNELSGTQRETADGRVMDTSAIGSREPVDPLTKAMAKFRSILALVPGAERSRFAELVLAMLTSPSE